jgi:hypothetical protein
VLKEVAAEIRKLQCQRKTSRPTLLYGNVNWSGYSRSYDGRFNRFKLFRRNICHQAIFYQRSVFERLGYYNTKYRLWADWEFNIRCFNDQGIHKCYIPLRIADYEGSGTSATTYDLAFEADFPRIARVLANQARSAYAEVAVFRARELLVQAGFTPACRQILEALRLSHSPRVVRRVFSFLVLWLRIMGSRLKRTWRSARRFEAER